MAENGFAPSDYMKIIRVCFPLSLTTLVAGCAGWRETPIDPAGLSAVQAETEIVVMHHRSYDMRYKLVQWPRTQYSRPKLYPPTLPIKDPTMELQDQFVAGLRTVLGLDNIRVLREPQYLGEKPVSELDTQLMDLFDQYQPERDLSVLKDEIGTGLVFDFTPRYWGLLEGHSQSIVSALFATPLVLRYAVQGRLVRLDGPAILWQAVCSVRLPFEIANNTTGYELAKNPNSVVSLKRLEAATLCADELLKKALGNDRGDLRLKNGSAASH